MDIITAATRIARETDLAAERELLADLSYERELARRGGADAYELDELRRAIYRQESIVAQLEGVRS